MKTFLKIILGLICLAGRAQVLDTLYTNEHYNVALFFPQKIRQAVVGSENYIFSYNQEHPQYLGLLKGAPGKSSNLLAITQDGNVYSYVIAHKEELPKVVYFLETKASLGNEGRQLFSDTSSIKPLTAQIEKVDERIEINQHLENRAKHYYITATETPKRKKKDGISLQINNMIYNREEVYVVFEVSNTSGIHFEPEYLRLFITQGNKRRNSSFQKILRQPLVKYKLPEIIKNGERKKFVYVFSKFTVGEKEQIEVELREKNGNRLLRLQLRK